jgi:hypothetical protein
VENNWKNSANKNVPSSLKIAHDDVGSDHTSVGILQQQVGTTGKGAGWGTVAQAMNIEHAVDAFLGAAKKKYHSGIKAGDLAQAVQVSGYPLRYGQAEAQAQKDLAAGKKPVAAGGGGGTVGAGADSKIVSFINAQKGKRYIYGSSGPNIWDCSSLSGAVWAMVVGRANPGGGHRFFTTRDFPLGKAVYGLTLGEGAATTGFSLGVNNGQGGSNHMDGRYFGLKFEAANPRVPVRVGSDAQDTSHFAQHYHIPAKPATTVAPGGKGQSRGVGFAEGGLIDLAPMLDRLRIDTGSDRSILLTDRDKVPARIVADRGATLPARSTTVVTNNTSQPEHVGFGMTTPQMRMLAALIAQSIAANQAVQVRMNGEVVAERAREATASALMVPGLV